MIKLIPTALLWITVVGLATSSKFVFAADQSPMISSSAGSTSANTAISAKDFQSRKATILQHISDRLTKIQKIQSCVQAASDFTTMRACKPSKDKNHASKH
jgi:hypothetical protein